MTYFFSADWHYNHYNIIRYCNRPFSTLEEMNNRLVENWNKTVKPNDICYFLGDFAFKNIDCKNLLKQLHGKIHLILGNHDNLNKIKDAGFQSIDKISILKINKEKIILCHYPLYSWEGSCRGTFHLFGHCHGRVYFPDKRAMDVGVDANYFCPVSYEQISYTLLKRPLIAV